MSESNGYVQRGMVFETTRGAVVLSGPVHFGIAKDEPDDDGGDDIGTDAVDAEWRVTAQALSAKGRPTYEGVYTFDSEERAYLAADIAAMRYARGEPCYPRDFIETTEAGLAAWEAEHASQSGPSEEPRPTPPTPQ